jgi:chromosome segregation ATPase
MSGDRAAAESPRGGDDEIRRRQERLEARLEKQADDHGKEQRATRELLEDLRRELAEFKSTRESLGRAFERIEALEGRDRADGEALASLKGTMERVSSTLDRIDDRMRDVPGLQTTVKHHARALWLMASGFVGAVLTFLAKWLLDNG